MARSIVAMPFLTSVVLLPQSPAGDLGYIDTPILQGDRLVRPAYLTVFLNGVLLHHHKEKSG